MKGLPLVAGATLVVLLLSTFSSPPAQAQSISLSITSGTPGISPVVLSGSFYTANISVTVKVDDKVITTVMTDDAGKFTLPITDLLPPKPNGATYKIDTIPPQSVASPIFTARSGILATPASGPVGTSVTVTGRSYPANTSVTVNLGSVTVTSAVSDVNGSFTVTFVMPPDTGCSLNTACSFTTSPSITGFAGTFTLSTELGEAPSPSPPVTPVVAAITLTPAEGSPGKAISLVGEGFDRLATATIKFGGVIAKTAKTDEEGKLNVTLSVPEMSASPTTVSVSTPTKFTSSSFAVKRGIGSVEPPSGPVGTIVTLKGGGYRPTQQLSLEMADAGGSFVVASVKTNERGSFIATFTVPRLTIGMKAIDTSPLPAEVGFHGSFEVTPLVVAPPPQVEVPPPEVPAAPPEERLIFGLTARELLFGVVGLAALAFLIAIVAVAVVLAKK